MINSLITAIKFLTILPLQPDKEMDASGLGKAAGWFPLVGALIGGITAAAYYGLNLIFPSLLAAVLAAAVWILLTGGLHLDGLADSCDGLLYAGDPQRRLEIMKDPHHGTFAGIGLTLVILLKMVGLFSLLADTFWLVLPFVSALARWLLLPAGRQASARPGGLGDMFASGLRTRAFFFGAFPVIILGYFIGWQAAPVAVVVTALAFLVFRFARARLGGMTGDVFGLVVELVEVMALIGFCMLKNPLWI